MNIFLTGGAGYIGSQVAHLLLDNGHQVTIIDNLITGNKKLVPKRAKFIKCDIANSKIVKSIIMKNKFDAVFHFAGLIKVEESTKFPKKYLYNNFKKGKIFLKTCIKNNLKTIVFSSTASIYALSKNMKYKENNFKKPLNPYALSKLKLEKFIQKQAKESKVCYAILRYFNVAGSDIKLRTGLIDKKSSHLIKVLCEAGVGKRKKMIINGNNYKTKDGTAVRDFIHVVDLARIHILILKKIMKMKKSIIYNCGYGKGFTVLDVVKAFKKISSRKININFGPRRKGDLSYVVADVSKIKKNTNWKPKYNNLNYILKSALNWEKKIKKMGV